MQTLRPCLSLCTVSGASCQPLLAQNVEGIERVAKHEPLTADAFLQLGADNTSMDAPAGVGVLLQ
eukprot:1443239-Amphidinium_carterae.1